MFSPLIDELITALRTLPSVGPKSAQRMAFQLLQHNRDGGERLANAISAALDGVGRCEQCRTLSEQSPCRLCSSQHRDHGVICVVEAPTDIMAFEQSGSFNGKYFVLHGHLSPLDGVGPEDLGLPALAQRLASGDVRELIIATNPTIEGEATAQVLAEMGQTQGVTVSRLAQGVPLGGELEFLDGGTLAHALNSRQPIAS